MKNGFVTGFGFGSRFIGISTKGNWETEAFLEWKMGGNVHIHARFGWLFFATK